LELKFEYPDHRTAENVMWSLDPDNAGYVRATVDGNTLKFYTESEDAGSLRNTADDLLSCLKIAEETIGLGSR